MANPSDRIEVITSVQRRRRWSASEKVCMVDAASQLFTWRRLVAQGGLTAAGSGEEVVPVSDYRALQSQVRELHRLFGKKTLQAEILKEALEHATGSKKHLRLPPLPPYGYRRVHAILKRQALAEDRRSPNHKRVYRVMKAHGLLLERPGAVS